MVWTLNFAMGVLNGEWYCISSIGMQLEVLNIPKSVKSWETIALHLM
jgi:hypothetical protein